MAEFERDKNVASLGDAGAPTSLGSTSLARLFTAYAGLQILLAVASLVRNKVTAMSLGPAIYGEFAQLINVSALLVASASLGMGVALGRGLAVTDDRNDRQRSLGTALTFTVVLSTVLCAVTLVLVWSGEFLRLLALPPSSSTMSAAVITVAAVPAICLQGLYVAALQGLLDAEGMARSRGIAVGLATVMGIPLILRWGLAGAAVSSLLMAVCTSLALGLRLRKLSLIPLRLTWSRSAAVSLLALGLASTASAMAHSGADVVARTIVIAHLGAQANGLIQAPLSVTGLAQGVLLSSVGAISVAVVARAQGAQKMQLELTRMLDFMAPFAALAFAMLVALAPLVLRLLFSDEFISAQGLFLPVGLYQFTVVLYWIIGSPLLAAGRAGLWLSLDLIGAAAKVGFTWLLVPRLGTYGLPLALLLFAALHLLLSFLAIRWALKINIPKSRLVTTALAAGVVTASGWLARTNLFGMSLAGLLIAALTVWCYRTYRSHS